MAGEPDIFLICFQNIDQHFGDTPTATLPQGCVYL